MADYASLKAMVRLSHKVVMYAPTKDKNSNPLPAKVVREIEEKIGREMSEINGGATITDGVGFWVLPSGQICREKVRLILSFTENLEESIDKASELIEWIKYIANQDAVSLEVDNELFIL